MKMINLINWTAQFVHWMKPKAMLVFTFGNQFSFSIKFFYIFNPSIYKSVHVSKEAKSKQKKRLSFLFFVFQNTFWVHACPALRLPSSTNQNLKPQLDNRTEKCDQNVLEIGRPYLNTNSLKSFKYLRKTNLQCRKSKNV